MIHPLSVSHLSKYYGDTLAVNDVSFHIEEGEIFGLLGPNGAGKTSIISMITTLEKPSAGTISIFGLDALLSPKKAKQAFGCVPQELIHHGFFTVEEILFFHSGYYGLLQNQERIDFLIRKLNLSQHRKKKVKELSGGIKRRLLIAKALVHKPKLLLLDEPTAGVDIELRQSLWEFVAELKKEGTSVLLTTHYLEEAEQLCDRVAFMNKGVLQAIGKTKELIDKLSLKKISFSYDRSRDLTHPNLIYRDEKRCTFAIAAKESVGAFLATLPIELGHIEDLEIKEGRLEDVFQKIMSESYE